MNKIINYEKVEEQIMKIENILADFDMEEKQLILRFVQSRVMAKIQQHKIQDNLNNVKMGGLFGKVMKMAGKRKGDDEEGA